MATIHTKRVTDLFRPVKKGDRLRAVYLYADGHALASFERYVRDVDQRVHYYKQIDSLGIQCRFQGRVIFSEYSGAAFLRCMIAAGATAVYAYEKDTAHGSPNMQQKHIRVGYLGVMTPFGDVNLYEFEGQAADYTYQPEVGEVFNAGLTTYGYQGGNVAETLITRLTADGKLA